MIEGRSDKKLVEIDFLRSISIIFIMITHSPAYIHNNYFINNLSPYLSYLGLGMFVFLSGYLIYYKNPIIRTKSDIIAFYTKRIKRIYILYWIALISFILVFGVVFLFLGYKPPIDLSCFSLIAHLFGAQVLLAPRYVIPYFTLWYIGLIVIYYCIYPFLIRYSKDIKALFLNSILIFILLYIIHTFFNVFEIRFFIYYFIFISGIIIASNKMFRYVKYEKYFLILPIILICSTILSIKIGINLSNWKSIILIEILMISFNFMQLYTAEQLVNYFSYREKQLLILISTASYCVFLFHRPILFLFYQVFNLYVSPNLSDILMMLISYPILFIVSYYIQKFEFYIIIHQKRKTKETLS
jgi:peptidoglycan/LPS O-acetylase OafA/YrhL